jgi:hypothetical protein
MVTYGYGNIVITVKDYVITADVARGDGADYSAFHIMEVESMKQVGSYKGKIDTKEYGRLLNTIGREYNNALVVVENAKCWVGSFTRNH